MKKIALTTTFELLKNHDACKDGYKKLAKHLGGITKYGRRTPINLLMILESNGVEDTLWCLRATKENCDKVARLMAADFAEEVLPIFEKSYPTDKRPRVTIQAVRDFANGLITKEELADAAWDAGAAAVAAAVAAAGAARAAAGAAAVDAAGAAAGAARAARAAAWDAVDAAGAAAWDAADAAGAAAGEKQAEIIRRYLK